MQPLSPAIEAPPPNQQYDWKYSWVRTRQLEGTFSSTEAEGVWPINYQRVLKGWGQLRRGQYWEDDADWPPPDPSAFDEEAKQGRIDLYSRVWNADDCFRAFARGSRVTASFRVTSLWKNPEEGRLDFSQAGQLVLGGHSLGLRPPAFFTPSPLHWFGDDYFVSPNSWGEGWGNRGWAAMTTEFFDREMYEAWSVETGATMPDIYGSGIQPVVRWDGKFIDRRFFLIDIIDADHDDRLAWSIAVHRHGELNVEELYVKPSARGHGFATKMLDRLLAESRNIGQPLRFWIPFADAADPSNLERTRAMFARRGLRIDVSPMPWAACCATSGTPVEGLPAFDLPPKPAFTFAAPLPPVVDWERIQKEHDVSDEFLQHVRDSLEQHHDLLRRLA